MRWLALFGCIILAMIAAALVIALLAEAPWWGSGLFGTLMVIGIIAIWVLALIDIWRRADLSVGAAVLWSFFIIILPFITLVVYYFARPGADKIRYRGDPVLD